MHPQSGWNSFSLLNSWSSDANENAETLRREEEWISWGAPNSVTLKVQKQTCRRFQKKLAATIQFAVYQIH